MVAKPPKQAEGGAMSRLIRNRWLRWTLFLAAVITLGVSIYQIQPPAPLCEFSPGKIAPQILSGDGQRLVTLGSRRAVRAGQFYQRGPLQIWDTRTGAEIASLFDDQHWLYHCTWSDDRRYVAAELLQTMDEEPAPIVRKLVLIDLAAGKVIELAPAASSLVWSFSPQSRYLVRVSERGRAAGNGGAPYEFCVFETASGRLIDCFNSYLLDFDTNEDTIIHFMALKGEARRLVMRHVRTGQTLATLDGVTQTRSVAPGWHLMALEKTNDNGDTSSDQCVVWNLRERKVDAEFQCSGSFNAITPDGKWLAANTNTKKEPPSIELFDLASGRRLARSAKGWSSEQFSPDSQFLLAGDEASHLAVLDVPSLQPRWRRPAEGVSAITFSGDGKSLLFCGPSAVNAFDVETGRLRRQIPFTGSSDYLRWIVTPARHRLAVMKKHERASAPHWLTWPAWLKELIESRLNDAVVVLETDTCRPCLRVAGLDTDARLVVLSDDGGTLVTGHPGDDNGVVLRCWDVDAWKPLHWAIGVPAGLALLGTLLAWWRGWRTKKVEGTPWRG
jgi:WD40 repeat protein